MPLMQVSTARRQSNVLCVVAEAAVTSALIEEHKSFGHDDAPFFHQAFDGQVQGPGETRWAFATSVGRCSGREEEEKDRQGTGKEAEEVGTTEGEEVDHDAGERKEKHSDGAPAAQE
jgi:hypothetical protein|eukprot:evm.model.NODE_2985_length_11158_cov_21.936010.2